MRKLVLAVILLLTASTVSSLTFDVEVSEVVNLSDYDLQHMNETEHLHTANVTLENRGSIGCTYRLKGEYEYNDETFTRYSESYPLWSGNYTLAELNHVPMNYTGEVETSLYAEFCDTEKHLENFTFEVTENTTVNETVESETLDVADTRSQVELDQEEGLLVPEEDPGLWKTSSAQIRNGGSTVEYDAPIFREGVNITYTVLNNESEPVGTTEVWLNSEETVQDRLRDNMVYILVALLLIVNAVLLLERRKLAEK